MMSEEEKKKVIERHMMLTIFDGPNIQRGAETKKLSQMYAAIPLAQEYAEKCNGMLQRISFGKFVGNIGIVIQGNMDALRRDLDEFRLLIDAADDMKIERFDNEIEVYFTFWDIYEVKGKQKTPINHTNNKIKMRKVR